ncbi:MAG: hypothetical protein WBA54_03405 [Acidaminobacteraceae bacterium]
MKIQYIFITLFLIILNIPLYKKIHKTMFPAKGEFKNGIISTLFSDDTHTRIYFAGRRTSNNVEYFFGIVIAILVVELGALYWIRLIYVFYN